MDNKKNILIIAVGVLLLVIGFFCLAQGPAENPVSLTVAPLILVFAYLVVMPIGILWNSKKKKSD
jgi:predicted tellurium resistance membrane protein TerC